MPRRYSYKETIRPKIWVKLEPKCNAGCVRRSKTPLLVLLNFLQNTICLNLASEVFLLKMGGAQGTRL